MRFDPSDLRLFLAVVNAGSITRGAMESGLSLPAASERLRDMETVSKVRFLERQRRGVVPTEAGEALAHHARLILNQMGRMFDELAVHAGGIRATVSILANTAALTEFLPARLAKWMVRNPNINVELKERQSIEIAQAVAAGLGEIGILSRTVDTPGLELFPFAVDQLVVVVPRDHELAAIKQVAFIDVVHHDVIGLLDGALQEHLEAHAARLGARLKMRVRVRTFDGICGLVAEGAGVGIMPQIAARRCARSVRIAYTGLVDDWAKRQLSICVRQEAELRRPARGLLDHLKSGVH